MIRFHNGFREHLDILRTRSKYLNNIRAPLLYSPHCFWTQIKTKGTGLQHIILGFLLGDSLISFVE